MTSFDDYIPDDPERPVCNYCSELAELETDTGKHGGAVYRYACTCGVCGPWVDDKHDAMQWFVSIKI